MCVKFDILITDFNIECVRLSGPPKGGGQGGGEIAPGPQVLVDG